MKYLLTGSIVLIAAALFVLKYWDYITNPWTRNGQVFAQVIQITPRVSGPLVKLPVVDNQFVKAGDLLFKIDPRTFEADLEQARADLDNTRDQIEALAKQVDAAQADVEAADATIQQSQAAIKGYAAGWWNPERNTIARRRWINRESRGDRDEHAGHTGNKLGLHRTGTIACWNGSGSALLGFFRPAREKRNPRILHRVGNGGSAGLHAD